MTKVKPQYGKLLPIQGTNGSVKIEWELRENYEFVTVGTSVLEEGEFDQFNLTIFEFGQIARYFRVSLEGVLF